MGGLARRVSYTERFRERLGRIPSLTVDSGYFLADQRSAHGELRPDISAKNDWVAKAYDQFPVDAANLSSRELKYVSTLLTKSGFETRAPQHLLKCLVSANTRAVSQGLVSPPPFIVKEVTARRADGVSTVVRIAFIGLTEAEPAPPPGFEFLDPVESARRVIPEARKRADLVIALAYVKPEHASRIAREAPGIDAMIVSNSEASGIVFVPPVTAGNTLIVFTPLETRMIGELRFYRDAAGKFSTVTRFITLDEVVPDNQAAKQLTVSAIEAETVARRVSNQLLENWLVSSRTRKSFKSPDAEVASKPVLAFIGAARCAQCHGDQYSRWAISAHAHATDPLPPRQTEFEPSCLNCHATGSPAKGAGLTELPGLQSVQCEQCHGPGSEHAAKPAKGYGRITDMNAACSTCHTPATSPAFDLRSAWAKIKH
ncbi:MAG TPA: multiheme c-type cytochrome [Blastocatellia bacterium]|nr:multiheme c-type cytochrome [Blastocatellia bacterium]